MALLAVVALTCLFFGQIQVAALAGLFFAYIIWSHFKHSSIVLAARFYQNGDHDRATALLDEVPNPDRLSRTRRGYYEFMRGNIALRKEQYEEAEYHFQVASRFPLGGKNDKAFVMIHLANLALRKRDGEKTRAYIAKAKEMASTPKAKDIIDKIEREADRL
jgi:outer membrane PBP1 activator LpoA protein